MTALNLKLALGLMLVFAASLWVGSTGITPLDWWRAQDPAYAVIVFEIRLPRTLAAVIVGAALGVSGAALQGLLRNPLAEPGVLGVSASASLFAALVLLMGWGLAYPWLVPFAAVAGAVLVSAALVWVALKTQSVVTLILVGVGFSSVAGALLSLGVNLAPNPFSLADLMNWLLGSVANRSFAQISQTLPCVMLGAAVLWRFSGHLSVLSLGDEAAQTLGVDLRRLRVAIVAGAGLATGGAVALAGAIGFVGLVAPHFVRPWVGYDPARSLVPAGLLGAILLALADLTVRLLPSNQELNLGVLVALLGAPVFIYIVTRRGQV